MCKFCDELQIKTTAIVDGREIDISSTRGLTDLMLAYISKENPEVGIILKALDEVMGESNWETLTLQDIIGSTILLKTLAHTYKNPAVRLQAYEAAVAISNLPQAINFFRNFKPEPRDGRYSTTLLLDKVPKPN